MRSGVALRALSGRRSAGQIRSFTWTGDVNSVVPLLSRYPLPLRDIADWATAKLDPRPWLGRADLGSRCVTNGDQAARSAL